MKVLFSYRDHIFSSFLLASLLGHAVAFGMSNVSFDFFPKFGVQQAPSSMEVMLVKLPEPKPEKNDPGKVLTAQKASPENAVAQQPEAKPVKTKNAKTVVTPDVKGAVDQNKDPFLKNSPQVYPEHAREQGWEGVAVVEVLVGRNGLPDQVALYKSSGYKILDHAALKSIRSWQFRAARAGSVSFASRIKIPIRFSLVAGEDSIDYGAEKHE